MYLSLCLILSTQVGPFGVAMHVYIFVTQEFFLAYSAVSSLLLLDVSIPYQTGSRNCSVWATPLQRPCCKGAQRAEVASGLTALELGKIDQRSF